MLSDIELYYNKSKPNEMDAKTEHIIKYSFYINFVTSFKRIVAVILKKYLHERKTGKRNVTDTQKTNNFCFQQSHAGQTDENYAKL